MILDEFLIKAKAPAIIGEIGVVELSICQVQLSDIRSDFLVQIGDTRLQHVQV